MARRRIGQERLGIAKGMTGGGATLDEMSALIDWAEIDRCCSGTYAAAKGKPCCKKTQGIVDVHPGRRLGLLAGSNHQFPKPAPDEQLSTITAT